MSENIIVVFLAIFFLSLSGSYIYQYRKLEYKTKLRKTVAFANILVLFVFLFLVHFTKRTGISYLLALSAALYFTIMINAEGMSKEGVLAYTGRAGLREIAWEDVRFLKVDIKDRYTVVEFIGPYGLVKQYYSLDKYGEIKSFLEK